MRVCLFTPTFLPKVGGTEYVTDRLAREIHSLGHETIVLAQGKKVSLDVPYEVRWFAKPPFVRWHPESTANALQRLHEEKPLDIVFCNYANPTGYGAVQYGLRVGLGVIVISHGGDLYLSSGDRKRPGIWKRTEFTYQNAHGLIAISPYIVDLIHQIEPEPKNLRMIPNGIDLDEFQQPSQRPADFQTDRPFCLCLGNLGPMKGFADAIEAYAELREQLGDLALVIVGDGELRESLEKSAKRLDVGDDVIFCGRRTGNDKRWFLQNCKFGVMPSIEEGHPIVGLELLACGKPLVCSLNPAFDNMYTDGENAFRVPAENASELAVAIMRMDRTDREPMAAECIKRSKDYQWNNIALRYLGLAEDVQKQIRDGES